MHIKIPARPYCGTWALLSVLPLALGLLGVAWLSSGCATSQGQVPGARLARMAGTADYIGTARRVKNHPEEQAVFEAATQALASLIAREQYDPAAFAAIIEGLPVLQSKDAQLYASGVVLLWEEAIQDATVVDKAPVVAAVANAVYDGILRGIAAAPFLP